MVLLDPGSKDFLDGFAEVLGDAEGQRWTSMWEQPWTMYGRRDSSAGRESRTIVTTMKQLARTTISATIPLVVVSATDPTRAAPFVQELSEHARKLYFSYLGSYHRSLAADSSRGRHVEATSAGHVIHLDQPEVVLDAIGWVVVEVRSGS